MKLLLTLLSVLAYISSTIAVKPTVISVTPAQNWEGIDGSWNTFALRVGTPPQVVRVLPSTNSQETWVIAPRACLYEDDKDACAEARGGVFNTNASTTFAQQGLYDLGLEKQLNYSGNAIFGYDTVALGYAGEGGPSLNHQIVGALAKEDYWFGHLGLHPKSTNFTNVTQNVPSFVASLRTEGLIPSVSWGYTAGAPYRFAKVQASLSLGGYDRNRFIPNNITFPMAPDNERDLLVFVNGITAVNNHNIHDSLLPIPIYAFIDSTIAEIWLPVDACRAFESAFGLSYDLATGLYFVSDTLHNALISANPNITFVLSSAPGLQTTQITLPYAAFDLTAKAPYRGLAADQRYFPLRRAANDTQYTLGRTFLQEAYISVDWERQNFSVYQCLWNPNAPQLLVPIASLDGHKPRNKKRPSPLSTAVVVGIVFGVVILLGTIIILSFLLWRSNRRRKQREADVLVKEKNDDVEARDDRVIAKVELDAGDSQIPSQFPMEKGMLEKGKFHNEVFELPGDLPDHPEADGRELSEKEAIRVREHRYNGIEEPPLENSPISPVSPSTGTGLTRNITSATVGISPITPSDGTSSLASLRGGAIRGGPSKKRIKASDVHIIGGSTRRAGSAHGTPGEALEGDTGPALTDTPVDRKRFSFERKL
ncbi:acid protease [Microthyrium microscopicum]|uniref:Acid protease n=1 Tax=Microthyrium microscopicum TaxID=703497 RepID=A0A6A6UGS8_9PEZI|nr:acid protease [Microthyrium microscopicum]